MCSAAHFCFIAVGETRWQMAERRCEVIMLHAFILDFKAGVLLARCSCGHWSATGTPGQGQRLAEVYERLRKEHAQHADQRPQQQPPTPST